MLALIQLARAAAARLASGGARRLALTGGATAGGVGLGNVLFGADGQPRRRRRKRILTQSDRADIAFVVATLGAPAGKSFALIVAARA